jgi:hypothetical protein
MGGYKLALALVAGWRDTDAGGAPDPGAIVCGQHGASARVARPWVAGRTGSAGILCGHACTSTNPPLGFWSGQQGARRKTPKGRRLGCSSPAVRVYSCNSSQASTRPDETQGSPGRGKRTNFNQALAHDVEATRRSGSARRGWWRGAAFELARVYGGTQPLGGYAHESCEA